VGLTNTRDRLAVLYGGNYRFAVLNQSPGLRVDLALPLESAAPGTAPGAAPARGAAHGAPA
jgi:hypothetical protein